MNTIRQSDEQLTAAERATQEAESQKREAEYRAQKEQESRQRSEANQKTMEEAHKKEMEDMTVDLKKAMEEQNRYRYKIDTKFS